MLARYAIQLVIAAAVLALVYLAVTAMGVVIPAWVIQAVWPSPS